MRTIETGRITETVARLSIHANRYLPKDVETALQKARTEELIEYEKYTKTAKYVEEVAKDKLGLVYEDEIIFESEDGN